MSGPKHFLAYSIAIMDPILFMISSPSMKSAKDTPSLLGTSLL